MSNDPNPYYQGTEEWHGYVSGVRDVQARIANGHVVDAINEDHLVMLGQAYCAGIRAETQRHLQSRPAAARSLDRREHSDQADVSEENSDGRAG